MKIIRKAKLSIAPLSPVQIKKLREYEKEMEIILVAYQKGKEERK